MTALTDPNHPLLIRGRRHARELMESAARIERARLDATRSDAREVLSTSLKLTVSAALVDGYAPQEAYEAVNGFLAWIVCRLPPEERLGVLGAMVKNVADQIADLPMSPEAALLN